ncbi:hypothetical protein D3C87_1119960 [compost metagenome]
MLGDQQRSFRTHELLHAVEAHQRLLGELVSGLGIVEQQAGGFHQTRANLQAGVARVFFGHRTERGVDLQACARVEPALTAFADQRVSQAEITFRILEARLRALRYGLTIGAGRGVEVFVGHRQFAQQRLPTHRQGRQANRLLQHPLRTFAIAFGDQYIGHAVVQRRHHREHLQGLFINALGLRHLATLEQQFAKSGKCPWQRPVSNDAVIESFQRFVLIHLAQRIGAITQAQR